MTRNPRYHSPLTFGAKSGTIAILFLIVPLGAGCSPAARESPLQAPGSARDPLFNASNLAALIESWPHRDGGGGARISDDFCWFVLREPELFLNAMSQHRDVFDSWLSEMPILSFVDEGGDAPYLEWLRARMAEVLQYPQREGPPEAVRRALLAVLARVEIRVVD